jgi:hypothetical protein
MAQFLELRRGFCQQFAATMAMMAREVGIPSRIVVGFLHASDKNSDNGSYVMTTADVHAWPELYFEGVGWVRFEPTPGRDAAFPGYAPQTSVDAATTPTAPQTQTGPTPGETFRPSTAGRSEALPSSSGSGTSGPLGSSHGWWIALVVVLVALLPAGLRTAVRRARMTRPLEPPEAAESAWLEMRDRIRDLRLPWTGSMTPRARERAIAPLLHGDKRGLQALRRLAISVERARYAASLAPAATPAADAREVMAVIARQTSSGTRVKAFLWPASLLPDIRRGWQKLVQRAGRQ